MRPIGTIALLLALPAVSRATVETLQQVVWDFTQPEAVQKLARWTTPEHIGATPRGLGWDGEANASYDVTVSSRTPVAVGWSWHPVTAVTVQAEVVPPGQFTFGTNSTTFPSTAGQLYARFSADGRHWSTWQALELQVPRDKAKPQLFFAGTLRVPQHARKNYEARLREFAGTDRPTGVDEDKVAEWLLAKDPKFFERETPYVGYVEFLWETQVKGDQRVRKLEFNLGYGRSGKIQTPPGANDSGPWKFRAPDVK
jgi:hypothetical protein